MGGVKNHLKEGNSHGEEQPDVDHLDVRSNRKALGKAQEAKMRIIVCVSSWYLHDSLKLDFRQFRNGSLFRIPALWVLWAFLGIFKKFKNKM